MRRLATRVCYRVSGGTHSVVASGAVVINDVRDPVRVVGVPVKIMNETSAGR